MIDFPDIKQRIFQPFFEQAAAHRSLGEIQHIKQRILFAAIAQIARDFKIPQRIGIYHEIFRCIQIGQPVQMRKVCFDRFVQIIEQGCNRFLCLRRFRPVVRIEMLDDAVIDSAGNMPDCRKGTMRQPELNELVKSLAEGQLSDHKQFRHHKTV